jgi:hypothetical protein
MTEAPTLEAPVEAPAIENLPNATPVEEGFSSAVDRAFGNLDNVLQEPKSNKNSDVKTPVEPGNEETNFGDDATTPEDTFDEIPPEDQLDSDIDDWTPKAAKRFKQLKEERKQYRSEIDELRQKTTELRLACLLIHRRHFCLSGSLEMSEIDEELAKLGLEVWTWSHT